MRTAIRLIAVSLLLMCPAIQATAADPLIRAAFQERLRTFLAGSTGSSTRITRAVLLDKPMSIDIGEVTDKGSVNQRKVLEHRARLIEAIYDGDEEAKVIAI